MNKLVTVLIGFLLLIFSFTQVDLRLGELVAFDNLENIFKFLAEFLFKCKIKYITYYIKKRIFFKKKGLK